MEEKEIKRHTTAFQESQKQIQDRELFLLVQRQRLLQREEQIQQQQAACLQQQDSCITELEKRLLRLQSEQEQPGLSEQVFVLKEHEVEQAKKTLELAKVQQQQEQKLLEQSNWAEKQGLYAKKTELSAQQIALALQKKTLKVEREQFEERNTLFQDQLAALEAREEALRRTEETFALKTMGQEAEWKRREREVQQALELLRKKQEEQVALDKLKRKKAQENFELQMEPGFYLFATCTRKTCEAAGRSIWINKGVGSFDANRECSFTACRSCEQEFEDVNTIALHARIYSWEGKRITGEKAHAMVNSTELVRYVFEDLTRWLYLQITVERR